MKKILVAIGTRPEVIKMAPIIWEFKKDKNIDLTILSLAQHRELLDQMLNLFQIKPDLDLNIMKKRQSLPELTANLPIPLDEALEKTKPDLVLAQGDTTSVFMTALACAYRKIPFGHVEAGLRTFNYDHPFPEEMNRVLISRLSALHFAPTNLSEAFLLKEGIDPKTVFVTGNTVIDALHYIAKQKLPMDSRIDPSKKLVLVTLHRRENFDKLSQVCRALLEIADREDVQIFFPVHPNPHVKETVHHLLGRHKNIILSDPLDYLHFVSLMRLAYLILSDSGGVQEEAPALKTPVLVLREHTERPEAIESGQSLLVGTDAHHILRASHKILDHQEERDKMILSESPFGDGHAAQKIGAIVNRFLNKSL